MKKGVSITVVETNNINKQEVELAELMRKAQTGDKAAYNELLHAIAAKAEIYLRRRLAIRDDVEDVVQDILISINKARHTWDPKKPFLPWLHAIFHYRLQDYFRRVYRSREDGSEEIDAIVDKVSSVAPEDLESKDLVRQLLGSLNDKQRNIVQLLYIQGHSAQEVSDRMNISVSDVRVSAHRALKHMKKQAMAI